MLDLYFCCVFVDDSIGILMFTLRNTNNEWNDSWTTQLFYTISNTIIVVIIVIVIITLLGSHWLLSVSVLEVKRSDWLMSPDHWCFNKSGLFWEFFFLITAAGFQGPRGSLGTDGRDFSQSEFYIRSKTRLDQSHAPHLPPPPLALSLNNLGILQCCRFVCGAAEQKTVKCGSDLVWFV